MLFDPRKRVTAQRLRATALEEKLPHIIVISSHPGLLILSEVCISAAHYTALKAKKKRLNLSVPP